eukprot:3550904-Amphidinium_carterae.1
MGAVNQFIVYFPIVTCQCRQCDVLHIVRSSGHFFIGWFVMSASNFYEVLTGGERSHMHLRVAAFCQQPYHLGLRDKG